MANTIDQAFIKQFETDVHLAYQRMGSKLRNTIRSTNVSGNTARFQNSYAYLQDYSLFALHGLTIILE